MLGILAWVWVYYSQSLHTLLAHESPVLIQSLVQARPLLVRAGITELLLALHWDLVASRAS